MSSDFTIEEHWNQNLKPKVVNVLERRLDEGISSSSGALFTTEEYIKAYTLCFDMCEQKGQNSLLEHLYNVHTETIQRYLTHNVLPAIKTVAEHSADPTKQLEEIKFRWDNHTIMNKWYAKFFSPLDVKYTTNYRVPSLTDKSLNIFKSHIFEHIKVGAKDAILALIEKERDGEIVNKTIIKSIVRLYKEMGMGQLDVYTSDLEFAVLESTREYYSQKREQLIRCNSTPEFLIQTEQILKNEKIRVDEYLQPITEPKLLGIIDDEMIRKSYDTLLRDDKSGCKVLFANDKIEDLKIMFKLFHRIGDDGLKDMAKMFENYVSSQGHELLNQRADRIKTKEKSHDPKFVKDLLALHKKYSDLVQDNFGNHPYFDMSLKNSFEDFINEKVGETKNLVLLSSYCNELLKKVDDNLEESLKNILQLFLYLSEKDRFVDEYRNQLAKRLLSHNPTSADDEKIMITELKRQCGAEFTSKLEGMLQDFELGSQIRSEFNRREHAGRESVDFAAHVISPNHWPVHETPDVTIPPEITQQYIDVFTAWYEKKKQW